MFLDRRLWRMTEGMRSRLLLVTLLGMLALAAGIGRFVFLGVALALAFRGATFGQLVWPLAGVAAAIMLRALLEHMRHGIAHRTAARVQETLRDRLFGKIIELGPAWFARERTGGVMLSIVDGVEQLQTFFGAYLPQLFISLLAPLVIFAFIAWWDLPVASVMLGAALLALVMPIMAHRMERASAVSRKDAFQAYGEELLDAIQGLPTLKALGQGRDYGAKLAARARELSSSTMGVVTSSLLARGITDFGIGVGAAAALALGAYRVTSGAMTLEALLVVLMAGTEIFRPLRDLRQVLHQGVTGQSSAIGILALLDAPLTAPSGGARLQSTLTRPSMRFDSVRFTYPGERDIVLNDLSFEVASGTRVGVVGASGAGKSSIVRLLLRLYDPQSGSVSIGGRELRSLDPDTVRQQVAVVAQDTYLFHGTLLDNLLLGNPTAGMPQVEAAARAANIHDFISSLPDGYRTLIGERGMRLSGGQRQRIAIARALLRDAPILILDEALSSVDAENEAVIQQALDRLMEGRTTLILAHRLSSVIGADRIVVLDHGRVVESGRHDELMRRDGPYRRLMGIQVADNCNGSASGSMVAANSGAASDVDGPGVIPDVDASRRRPAVRDINADAAMVGWRDTAYALVRAIRPWRVQFMSTVLCGVGRVAAMIAVGVLGALIVAAVKSGDAAGALIIGLLVVAPLGGFLHVAESLQAHNMAYALLARMRVDLFVKLEALAPAYLYERRSGDLLALSTHDIETVEYFYAHTMSPAFVALLVPATVLSVLGYTAWPLALSLLPFLTYAGLSPLWGRRRIDAMGSAARGALGQLSAHVTETIQGLAELAAFQALDRRRAEFMTLVRRYHQTRLALLDDQARQGELLDVATGLGALAVAVAGAYLVGQGRLNPAMLPLLVLIATAAFLPVSEIAQVGRQLADTIASIRRLLVVHAEPVCIVDGPISPPIVRGAGSVQFEAVKFSYPGRPTPALADVSFEMKPGSTVALVGASGAGKTTVANLLLRFWDPDRGAVKLAGTDLRQLSLEALRRSIALVAQDTYLFNDTLEANLLLARPGASGAEVARAIERAALADFVASLPAGLHTKVGERGVQLSGGQRQRIAIARAFLRDAPILVLDEATSHLDTLSEAHVRAALDALMVDRTTMVIAHRLSTVRNAEQILVLDAGRIIERGTHDKLLAMRGAYASLVERQMGGSQIDSVAGRL